MELPQKQLQTQETKGSHVTIAIHDGRENHPSGLEALMVQLLRAAGALAEDAKGLRSGRQFIAAPATTIPALQQEALNDAEFAEHYIKEFNAAITKIKEGAPDKTFRTARGVDRDRFSEELWSTLKQHPKHGAAITDYLKAYTSADGKVEYYAAMHDLKALFAAVSGSNAVAASAAPPATSQTPQVPAVPSLLEEALNDPEYSRYFNKEFNVALSKMKEAAPDKTFRTVTPEHRTKFCEESWNALKQHPKYGQIVDEYLKGHTGPDGQVRYHSAMQDLNSRFAAISRSRMAAASSGAPSSASPSPRVPQLPQAPQPPATPASPPVDVVAEISRIFEQVKSHSGDREQEAKRLITELLEQLQGNEAARKQVTEVTSKVPDGVFLYSRQLVALNSANLAGPAPATGPVPQPAPAAVATGGSAPPNNFQTLLHHIDKTYLAIAYMQYDSEGVGDREDNILTAKECAEKSMRSGRNNWLNYVRLYPDLVEGTLKINKNGEETDERSIDIKKVARKLADVLVATFPELIAELPEAQVKVLREATGVPLIEGIIKMRNDWRLQIMGSVPASRMGGSRAHQQFVNAVVAADEMLSALALADGSGAEGKKDGIVTSDEAVARSVQSGQNLFPRVASLYPKALEGQTRRRASGGAANDDRQIVVTKVAQQQIMSLKEGHLDLMQQNFPDPQKFEEDAENSPVEVITSLRKSLEEAGLVPAKRP